MYYFYSRFFSLCNKRFTTCSIDFNIFTVCETTAYSEFGNPELPTAPVIIEHLPRPGIRTPDLPAPIPKVFSIRTQCWYYFDTNNIQLFTKVNKQKMITIKVQITLFILGAFS